MKNCGRLIAVVGPSGVGKDSVIDGVLDAMDELRPVKRTITRAAERGGEDHYAVSEKKFVTLRDRGDFCLHWQAHGLFYGIPVSVLSHVESGQTFIANLSRSVLTQAAEVFPELVVIEVTARPQTITQRLADRGRETDKEIVERVARSTYPLPENLTIYRVSNDGELQDAIDRAVLAIDVLSNNLNESISQ